MEKEKGLTKENIKKLFSWEGFKKELPWMLFFLVFFFLAYAHYWELGKIKELANYPCCVECRWNEYVEIFTAKVKEKYPTASVSCDDELKKCWISGMPQGQLSDELKKFSDELRDFIINQTNDRKNSNN
jgi:hypothetical protein